jgi:glycosyltransferase involved in cell wall biosynthesis
MYPFISILVPTKNVAPYIDQVLRSLTDINYPNDRFEIIILDGFSTDGTLEIVKKYPVISLEGSWNVPAFYNRVLNEVKGEIIAFGDGDAVVDKNWLNTLVPHFSDSRVAGAGGLCLTANPEKIVPRVIGYELKARYEQMPQNISRIATMNVLYRKSVLLQIGGFDEHLDTGYDTDIGHRICKAGYLIHFDPKAIVYHYNRPTLWSYFRQQYIYGKNVAGMYLQHMNIASGDEVTSFWMNVQPFVYTLIAIALLGSIVFPIAGILAGILVIGLLLAYAVSAVQLSIREKDASALFFIVLCFVRGIGWTAGGVGFVISSLIPKKSPKGGA